MGSIEELRNPACGAQFSGLTLDEGIGAIAVPERYEHLDFDNFYLQPMDGPLGQENTISPTIRYFLEILQNPNPYPHPPAVGRFEQLICGFSNDVDWMIFKFLPQSPFESAVW